MIKHTDLPSNKYFDPYEKYAHLEYIEAQDHVEPWDERKEDNSFFDAVTSHSGWFSVTADGLLFRNFNNQGRDVFMKYPVDKK